MYRSLFSITEELGLPVKKWYGSTVPETHYEYCLWLGNREDDFKSNSIYVGYASQLPERLPSKGVGFIIRNDISRDFSGVEIELIELDPSVDPAEVCLLIRDKVLCYYEVSRASQLLIKKLLRTSQIKELLDVLSEMLENPVFLNFHFLGQTFYFSGTGSLDDQVDAMRELKRSFHDEGMMTDINRIWNANRPEMTEDGFIYPGHRRIQAAISEGLGSQNKIGIITVFEVNRTFLKEDHALIGLISHIISEKAGDKGFQIQITGFQYEQFFHDIIAGKAPKEKPVWFNSVFGSRYKNFRLTVLDVRTLNGIVQDDIKYALIHSCPFSTCLLRGFYLVHIANIEPGKESDYYEVLRNITEEYKITAGVSADFKDLMKVKKYYSQAKKARETGSGKTSIPGVYQFADCTESLLAQSLILDGTAELYVHEAYESLKANDESEGTEYCATLEAFIECGFDHATTTKKLNIHRNTLTYRLNRIEEITGHSLKDGSFLKVLMISGAIVKSSI